MTGATRPASVWAPELDRAVPECPYVGLVPFDESDAPYFFGRQGECDVVVANLTTSRLTLLYAASGVGKSSVLRAGALPQFQQTARESYADLGVPDAAVAYVREWSLAPLDTIATAVLEAVSRLPGAGPVEMPGPPRLCVPWLREVIRRSGVTSVYLVLDQFEEYFRYHPNDRGDDGLAGELGRILSTRDLPVNVLLSIREDELAALDRFKGFIPRLYDNYLRLAHLGREAAREAINGPVDRYNQVVAPGSAMTVEPELTEALLDQVRTGHLVVTHEGATSGVATAGREDIETPYLQLVLTTLWDTERARGSSTLRLGTLEELGGAQTIVQTHLQTVLAELSPEQREVAAEVFRYLVTASGSKIALTAEDLADLSGVPVGSVQELLQSLSEGRQSILRPVPPPPGVLASRYEIFHDRMGVAVLDWRRRLLAQRAAQREQAEKSRKLVSEREEARAEAQAARQRLRQTLLAAGLVVVLLVAGGLGWLYDRMADEAHKQRLLSEAAASLNENPAQSLRKALDAYRITSDEETREAVLTAASVPHSRVVAGFPGEPRVTGMVLTSDQRHVVSYDAHGAIRVIDDHGRLEKQAKASRLDGTVVTAATSPSASHVVLATDKGSAMVVDVGTGTQVDLTTDDLTKDDLQVSALWWLESSPDDLVLVVRSSGLAATYSTTTGRQIIRLPSRVIEALPSTDARVLTSDQDSRLRVWDIRTAEKTAESSPLPGQTRYLRRYGQEVVGVTRDDIIRWDWRAGPQPRRYPLSFLNSLSQVEVDENAHAVTIAVDKEAKTYDLDDGSLLLSLPHHPDTVTSLVLCPYGRWITTAGADGRIRMWSTKLGTPTRDTYDLIAHRGDVLSVNYLRDGKTLISLGRDGTVQLWDVPQVQRFDLHTNSVLDLDMSADGRWLATASYDRKVSIVDPTSTSHVPVATIPVGARVKNVQFDPRDPHRIVTLARAETQPKGWRWDSGREAEQLPEFETPPGFSDFLVSLDISSDGEKVAAGDLHGTIYLWQAHTGKFIGARMGSGSAASGIAFDRSGRLLATTASGGIVLHKLGTDEQPTLLPLPDATTVAFDPLGKHIVGGTKSGVLHLWTSDGRPKHELVAHGSTAGSPSFSGDGSLVAVGTNDGLIEVWNVESGRRVLRTRQHGDSVNDVLFLPGDRSRLVSASDDSTVAVFQCDACADPGAVVRNAAR
ncbi:MAG: hypothetical protein ACRDRX_12105 [Pseudonocardiaceae bacterium]